MTLIFLIVTLLIISKEITLLLFFFISLAYFFIALIQNKTVKREGKNLTLAKQQQTEIIQETLGSKKDIVLKNNQSLFINEFSISNYKTELAIINISNAAQIPKYIVESLFIIILGTIAYSLKINFQIDPISILGSVALGIQRLLPAAFGTFQAYTKISGRYETSMKIIEIIENTPQEAHNFKIKKDDSFHFKKLVLKNIYYYYPDEKKPAINNVSLNISRGDNIGIIGLTGSGKSTLIDIIMGFLTPQKGKFFINDINILDKKESNLINSWRKKIAYVPQNIFLRNSTIIENIAFGEELDEINFEKAISCCESASIYDFIKSSEKGFYTTVGERGINLSGGQIQRIAIARALYNDSEILILDEATSALDFRTELEVICSLKKIQKNVTIIFISHRINNLAEYDSVIEIDKGRIHLIDKFE